MWKVLKYTKPGTRNTEQGLRCQDYVYYYDKDAIQVITLADGSGETDYARMGAEQTCRTLAELLAEHFDELYEMDKELVQFNVITNIQTGLYELYEKYKVGLQSFQSTFLGIAVNHKQGRFIAVHLGDGKICIKQRERIRIMSYPENGINKVQTFLTSVHKVGKHIRIFKDEIKDIQEFLLVSDGWDERKLENRQYFSEETVKHAEKTIYRDDVSMIALTTG